MAGKILVSGSGGLVGSALIPFLREKGWTVVRLIRTPITKRDEEIYWDPAKKEIEFDRLEGFDALVHLAGESVVGARWNAEKKEKIRSSRVEGSRFLCQALMGLKNPPPVVVSASAIGYYGDRGAEFLHESTEPGKGFLAEVCQEWEEAMKPLYSRQVRVSFLRISLVLSTQGGGLKTMLSPFRMGLGSILGSGRQYVSWIHIDDLVAAIEHVLTHKAMLRGPVIMASPNPVTQKEFAKTLGKVLHRPVFLWTPGLVLKMALGEMATELLLSSQRAEPANLITTGYRFKFPDLEGALKGKR